MSWDYQYDSSGNLARMEQDANGDGVVDNVWIYSNRDGRQEAYSFDQGADGVADERVVYEYSCGSR